MENENKPKKNIDWKLATIGVLLVVSIVTNVVLTRSVMKMHAFTMQFVSDVFYYTPGGEGTVGGHIEESLSEDGESEEYTYSEHEHEE